MKFIKERFTVFYLKSIGFEVHEAIGGSKNLILGKFKINSAYPKLSYDGEFVGNEIKYVHEFNEIYHKYIGNYPKVVNPNERSYLGIIQMHINNI